MLINLSNHPSHNWNNLQTEAAHKQFGGVVDITFPQIDPGADEKEIKILSEKYLKICFEKLKLFPNGENAVHLMGEFTFVFALAALLLNENITVIASTSNRNTINTENGKIVNFNFVRFREYKSPLIR